MALQIYNAGIRTSTRYLTPELAYFLGGIYAADESVTTEDKLYWAAPVRHNSKYATSTQITEHFDYVSEISGKVGGYIQMKESIIGTALDSGKNKTLLGFSTFFESTGLTDLCTEIPNLKTVLFNSDKEVKTAFILGVIDGRGTPDINKKNGGIRYISLDCPNNDIGNFLFEVFKNSGLDCNYNTARDRKEGGRPRRPQLRIKSIEYYMKNFGYISPCKFGKIKAEYQLIHGSANEIDGSSLLSGLKYLTR
ncbi:MAG: hypothetical protein K2J26_05255 [Ruminococcus sp.]|nr:hypothetical protein [Ruminococcus sp.]